MLGTKMLKSEFDQAKYMELASWCNNQPHATIKDMGDYYEVVDCTPTEEENKAIRKSELLSQLKNVNTELAELNVAVVFTNGDNRDDTTDVIINNDVITMKYDELEEYHTAKMQERANILSELKALK